MVHSFERMYYENPMLWIPERYGSLEVERARLAIRWLPPDVGSVLDAGCGNGILINQLQNVPFVVGIDRSLVALRHVQVARCQADAAHLPFNNGAFDTVVSMEVLEHLPFPVFPQALAEMVRVARHYILVTVPYREDRDLARVSCPACGCQFHPNYHMRSFDLPDLDGLFSNWDFISLVRVSGILPVKVPLFSREMNAILRRIHRRGFDLPWYTVCPQCGYSGAGSASKEVAERREGPAELLKSLVKPIWPKKTTYRWWIALYTRGAK